jgi:nitroreductase
MQAEVDSRTTGLENGCILAAGRGLGTCLVGGLDRDRIRQTLRMGKHNYPAFVQPVGCVA